MTVNGLLILDKPVGISSNRALQRARGIYRAKKAGHTGSLDPLASGMLPICFGEATKFSQYLLNDDKTYLCEATLGKTTTTGDAEGEVVQSTDVPILSQETIEDVLTKFRGDIWQTPSQFSALKHQGRPMYEYARKGIEIEVPSRQVTIHRLELIDFDSQRLRLAVDVSKGTYIRSLVVDIGDALGCGAYVSALRRISVGQFTQNAMISLETLQQHADDRDFLQQQLLPVHTTCHQFQRVELNSAQYKKLTQGQIIQNATADKTGLCSLWLGQQEFVGLGTYFADRSLKPKRLCAI